ncbi:centrosomal protein of 131 kDa-like isoform X2 [Babylonia areolata]|uniref:centrosomal protein of 131 kDa-like isoform X2 n=1 Tax=Babylonia areolata TaxID=304850 RepID=UPI003FD56DA6
MAQRKSVSDDLDLSLTGSQISARSSARRPGSAAQTKRVNASADVRNSKSEKNSAGQTSTKQNGMSRKAVAAPNTPMSHRSTASASSRVADKTSRTAGNDNSDFLALFESSSVQPQIRRPSSTVSTGSRGKKPAPNAVRLPWADDLQASDRALNLRAGATGPRNGGGVTQPSDRSEGPHNIFRPDSARSQSDDDELDDIEESLSQSISKLQTLQSQLSGINKNNSEQLPPPLTSTGILNSHRSSDTTPRNDSARSSLRGGSTEPTPRNLLAGSSPKNRSSEAVGNVPSAISARDFSSKNLTAASTNDLQRNGLANNMTSQGQKQKAKASLSSIENSYQNIKHKTPVNQVRRLPSGSASAAQTNQSAAEEYLQTLNTAATKIQRWFKRHLMRQQAGRAAMLRLLQQKKDEREEVLRQSSLLQDQEHLRQEDRKRAKEDRARQARQEAIQELHKKREEKRNEVKRKAEEEIKFLQASGKVTKTPSNTNIGARKKTTSGRNSSAASRGEVGRESATPRSEDQGAAAGAVGGVSPSLNDFLQAAAGEGVEKESNAGGESATQTGTRTTLNDLYDTLRKLEEEEHFVTQRSEKKPSWLDRLEKDQEGEDGSNLTAENLEKLNASKDGLSKSGMLTDDKLKSIMSFLDEVQVSDRLSEIDSEIHRMNEELEKPAMLVPSGEEVVQMEKAQAVASEVTHTVLSQRLELDEKSRTVSMLQKALNQQRELTVRHAREADREMKKRLDVQKEEYEEAIKRHLSFIDQLIDDKKGLGEKCEQLVKELKTVDHKYQEKIKSMEDSHTVEVTKLKEIHTAAEKLRREKWIEEKTKKIKDMTVKGLEPEIQRLIAKHKSEIKKIKQVHEAELLESDERAAQRYVKMTEELRDQLAQEKEAAVARERELGKERYEKQLQQEEEAYQQQRRRLYNEVQDEKDRLASNASRQRQELDALRRQLEDSHRLALSAMKEQFEKAKEEQERRHNTEVRELQERLELEKEAWEENYKKKHDTWLMQKERELKDQVRKERDKEIELVIARLEEDSCAAREENEKVTETKLRRLREKFEAETRELENSERRAVKKFNEIKAKATEVEGENERLKVIIKQKEEEIRDIKKLLEKMKEERGHVSDIIRQEFADRIVTTEEENRRIKNEISELRAKRRLELDKAKQDVEDIKQVKDAEMEEVHARVKQAIVKKEEVVAQLRQQYQAACKRADHLEGLLEQQRKQLLKK